VDTADATGCIPGTGAEGPDGFAELRTREFGYLGEGGHTFLDHTGAGLPPRSLVLGSARRITGGLLGNPHSESPASRGASAGHGRPSGPYVSGAGPGLSACERPAPCPAERAPGRQDLSQAPGGHLTPKRAAGKVTFEQFLAARFRARG
jgi:hypothetical protein